MIFPKKSCRDMPLHQLRGQNLLRFNLVQNILKRFELRALSDSVPILNMLGLLFSNRCNIVFYPLELYSISYTALFSEYYSRIFKVEGKVLSKGWHFASFIYRFIKLILIRLILSRDTIIIIPSKARKEYLVERGFKNTIVIVSNKPIVDELSSDHVQREDKIVLVGNINNRDDFLLIQSSAAEFGLKIYCYGLFKTEHDWVKQKQFSNVILESSVDTSKIPLILCSAKYAICLYNNYSINQQLSASSKIYEILYYGAIPIISNNSGLVSELSSLGANFTLASQGYNLFLRGKFNTNNLSFASLTFKNEIEKLDLFISSKAKKISTVFKKEY
jgi:hypothetical protein